LLQLITQKQRKCCTVSSSTWS